ncbi:MAG TPA: hypothetical protein VFE78_02390 [Gemmataceae bacterium]|nr:hypothetical protein [Gemmataceae bacterium]
MSTLSPADVTPGQARRLAAPRPAGRLSQLARRWRRAAQPAGSLALARSRRLRQSGRAVLLWALGLYVLAQPALLALMDRWHPMLFECAIRDRWQQLRALTAAAPDRPLLVMVGSSRTEAAFQAGRLNGLPGPGGRPWLAYNFGVPTVGPMREGLFLREMLDAGIRPRLLLVEFLPPLFNAPQWNLTSEERWVEGRWLSGPQLYRLRPYFDKPRRKGHDWLMARLAPAYGFRQDLQSVLSPPGTVLRPVYLPHDPWGWRLPEPLTPELIAGVRGVAHSLYPESLRRFRLGEGECRAMRGLLDLCRQEHVPVVLVLTPEGSGFRAWYSPEARAAPRRLLAELRAAYGVRVLDATEWLPDDSFLDGHHVTPAGAAAYTERLLAELRQLPEWSGEAAPR